MISNEWCDLIIQSFIFWCSALLSTPILMDLNWSSLICVVADLVLLSWFQLVHCFLISPVHAYWFCYLFFDLLLYIHTAFATLFLICTCAYLLLDVLFIWAVLSSDLLFVLVYTMSWVLSISKTWSYWLILQIPSFWIETILKQPRKIISI